MSDTDTYVYSNLPFQPPPPDWWQNIPLGYGREERHGPPAPPPRSRRAALAQGAGFLAEALAQHAERYWSVSGIISGLAEHYGLLPGDGRTLLAETVRSQAACLLDGGRVLCAPAAAPGWGELWAAVLAGTREPVTFDDLVAVVAGDGEVSETVIENTHAALSVAAEQGLIGARAGKDGATLFVRRAAG